MGMYDRNLPVWGERAQERLAASRVAVFGLGGVGGHAMEALVRAGVGALALVDGDAVEESNLNRQLIATRATVGMRKTEAARRRALEIRPDMELELYDLFYLPESADKIDLSRYGCIVDAIDTMTAKIELIERAHKLGVPVVSAMGCGNKLDPTRFQVTDLYRTHTDPVARILRRELKKRGVDSLRVVYSTEPPRASGTETRGTAGRPAPGSVSFVPAAAGLILAGEAVRILIEDPEKTPPERWTSAQQG